MKEYKQLKYDVMMAGLMCGVNKHPQKQMKELGYNVIGSVPQTISDSWWFTVEEYIEPLPKYLSKFEYNFNYWHNDCYKDCEYFKKDSRCCFGGRNCKKEVV